MIYHLLIEVKRDKLQCYVNLYKTAYRKSREGPLYAESIKKKKPIKHAAAKPNIII